MKKKLWMAVGSTAAIAAVSIGGTLALFSDTAEDGIDMVAGTLCIDAQRNDGEAVPGPMFYITAAQGATPTGQPGQYPTGVWAPGDTVNRTMTVANPTSCSSMDAWLTSVEADLTAGMADQYEAMADVMWVEVTSPWNGSDVKVGEGTLRQFLDGEVPIAYPDGSKIPVVLTGNRHMEFNVTMDLDADNSYQDKTLVVDFIVNAEQQSNNP